MDRPAFTCIFCLKQFIETMPEHFLLESLAGRRVRSDLDCPQCNQTFGSELDGRFSRGFDSIKNLLQIRRQSGKPAPAIPNLELGNTGKKVTLSGDGKIRANNRQIKSPEFPVENGKRRIELSFDRIEDLEKNFNHICKANKISPRQLVEALRGGKALETSTYTDETVKLSLLGDEAIWRRSAAKALLLYLADREGTGLVNKPEFNPIREFARYGKGTGWELTDWRPDLEKPTGSDLRDGEANHWIAVYRSQKDGPIVGVYCLFGFWIAQVDLTKNSAGPPFGHLHDLDPIQGTFVDTTFDPTSAENTARLEKPILPDYQNLFFQNVKSRLALAWKRAKDKALNDLIDKTFKDVLGPDFPNDSSIPPEKLAELSGKLGFRTGHHLMRMSYSEERDITEFLDRKERELKEAGLWK